MALNLNTHPVEEMQIILDTKDKRLTITTIDDNKNVVPVCSINGEGIACDYIENVYHIKDALSAALRIVEDALNNADLEHPIATNTASNIQYINKSMLN